MIWNWWGVPGVLVLVLAWTAAIIALRAGAGRSLNRRLAAVLLLEGVYGAGNFGLIFFVTAPEWAARLALVAAVAMATLPLQYLAFLGGSLRTPLVRPLRSRSGLWIIHVLTLAAAVTVLALPGRFITPVFEPPWAPWNFTYVGWGPRIVQFHGIVSVFALVVSIDAFRRAPRGSDARGRAGWFVIAFGIRDAFIAAIQILMPVVRPIPFWGDFIYNPVHGLMYAAYVPLLAYAVLRHQLLEIDLRVRFVLRQGSVGAVVAGVFLVVSELLESIVRVEGVMLGVLLAAVIAIVLHPAQRLAERFVSAVMPGVRPSAEYLDHRRVVVFRGALESAVAGGTVSERERGILARLKQDLGISDEEAAAIERSVREEMTA